MNFDGAMGFRKNFIEAYVIVLRIFASEASSAGVSRRRKGIVM